MTLEIQTLGYSLNSVTSKLPDRIERARRLIEQIKVLEAKLPEDEIGQVRDPYATARKLGIFRFLGVTKSQVIEDEFGSKDESGLQVVIGESQELKAA